MCTTGSDTNKPSALDNKKTLPTTPPKKEDWVPDGTVTHCMNCQTEKFSMVCLYSSVSRHGVSSWEAKSTPSD